MLIVLILVSALQSIRGGDAYAESDVQEPVAAPGELENRPYSPGVALLLSLAGTGLGYGILFWTANDIENRGIALGLLTSAIGPSAGHVYTGDYRRALWPSLARVTGTGLLVLAAYELLECEPDCSRGRLYLASSLGLHLGATLYSVIDAPLSARRGNQNALLVAPVIGPRGSVGMGVMVSGRF